jgi:hypothetical protein
MSHTPSEVFNPLNQYTMKKDRYMVIHMDKYVYRFNWLATASYYAKAFLRGSHEFYIIVDLETNEVVESWNY